MLDVKAKLDRDKKAGRNRSVAALDSRQASGRESMAEGPILVTGAAGFIGFHVAQRLLSDGRDVVGVDNMNAYYDPALKEARRAELAKSNQMRFVKLDLADREGIGEPLQGIPLSLCRAPCGAGRRSPFARRPFCLCRCQSHRLHDDPRRLPPQWLPASSLRVVLVGLRLQHEDAVLGSRQRRPSLESLWRIEEGKRADGACLCASVRIADDRLAIFHRIWAMGPAGHGHVDFCQGDISPANRSNCSTMAICGVISLTSMMSWNRSCG